MISALLDWLIQILGPNAHDVSIAMQVVGPCISAFALFVLFCYALARRKGK